MAANALALSFLFASVHRDGPERTAVGEHARLIRIATHQLSRKRFARTLCLRRVSFGHLGRRGECITMTIYVYDP